MNILLLGDDSGELKNGLESRGCRVRQTSEKIVLSDVNGQKFDWVISYNYRHLITRPLLDALNNKVVNLHISFLPWNRGADPNPWSILENTPTGVTIHQIDEGIDTGPILAQRRVELSDNMTLKESYELLHAEIKKLFWEIWPNMENYLLNCEPQKGCGSFHSLKDREQFLACLDEKSWDTLIQNFKKNRHLLRSRM